jgi:LysB family phage lysis regulatory protein
VSRQLDDARQHIADRDNTIQRVKRQAAKKATQQARLGQAQDAIASKLAASQLENRRLIDENAVLRAWADMRLPDDVVRLQTSPVFTGADDYLGRVSSGEPMHATGDSAANQR